MAWRNQSERILSTQLSTMELKRFDPLLDIDEAIASSVLSSCLYLLTLLVHCNIFKLLRRKKGRAVNRIIFYQQITQLIFGTETIYRILATFVYPMKSLIGVLGCYIKDIVGIIGFTYTNSASFFLASFRYVCIVHSRFLVSNRITPEALANFMICCQFLMCFMNCIAVRGLTEPSYKNGLALMACLGRYETSFDKDPSMRVCLPLRKGSFSHIYCYAMIILYLLTTFNILEMLMLYRIVRTTLSQTHSMKDLLSLSAYKRRQKEDGIMFSVNIWQLFLEVIFVIVFNVKIFAFNRTGSKLLDNLWSDYVYVHLGLVNAFYLLGDDLFLRSVTEVGLLKALWRAFFQLY